MVDRGDGLGDTTYTKIFVGGLAWETRRDTMRHYFEQFGEILEAVVIFDKNTGKSKGYGFVTFRDPESARKACENPYPVIDGRRANCNLASLGAQKNRPAATTSLLQGTEKFRQKSASSGFNGNSAYFHQSIPQNEYPYSPGYAAYSQDYYPMNYYNVYNGQQYSPYYPPGSHGFYLNYYPVYAQHGTTSGAQYPKLMQYPIIPQQFRVLPTSASTFASITALPSTAAIAPAVPGQMPNTSEPNPSST